jgi:hypothetical protein
MGWVYAQRSRSRRRSDGRILAETGWFCERKYCLAGLINSEMSGSQPAGLESSDQRTAPYSLYSSSLPSSLARILCSSTVCGSIEEWMHGRGPIRPRRVVLCCARGTWTVDTSSRAGLVDSSLVVSLSLDHHTSDTHPPPPRFLFSLTSRGSIRSFRVGLVRSLLAVATLAYYKY